MHIYIYIYRERDIYRPRHELVRWLPGRLPVEDVPDAHIVLLSLLLVLLLVVVVVALLLLLVVVVVVVLLLLSLGRARRR